MQATSVPPRREQHTALQTDESYRRTDRAQIGDAATAFPRRNTESGGVIAIVDPFPVTRESLRMWLSRAEPRFTVRDYADAAALSRCGPRALDIVLLNIGTAVPSAAHVTSIIAMVQAANPGTPVVLFSGVSGRAIAQAARSAGAKGLLHVSADRSLALAVLRLVLAGGTYIPVEASAGDPPDIELRDAAEPPGDPASLQLTRRQSDVLRCLQMGMSNKAIAHDLGICEGTIKVHVRALMTKLGASNRTQAAMFARRPSGM